MVNEIMHMKPCAQCLSLECAQSGSPLLLPLMSLNILVLTMYLLTHYIVVLFVFEI